MKATTSISSHAHSFGLNAFLLLCGIIASLLYVAMNIFVAMSYPGYSSVTYTVSELSAIGAPTRPLWTSWAFVYTFLMIAFGWGVVRASNTQRVVKLLGWSILIYGALGIGWHFAPMHQREVLSAGGGTLSDTMHIVFSFVTVLLMLLAMGFGAAAFGRTFRWYTIASVIVLMTFGMLTAREAPGIDSNQPTPMIGVWERINIGVFLIWVIILSIVLMKRNSSIG